MHEMHFNHFEFFSCVDLLITYIKKKRQHCLLSEGMFCTLPDNAWKKQTTRIFIRILSHFHRRCHSRMNRTRQQQQWRRERERKKTTSHRNNRNRNMANRNVIRVIHCIICIVDIVCRRNTQNKYGALRELRSYSFSSLHFIRQKNVVCTLRVM